MCQKCVFDHGLSTHTIVSSVCVLEPCLLTKTVQGSAAIFPNCMLLRICMQVAFWLLAVEVVAVG